MANYIAPVRGTYDIFGTKALAFNALYNICQQVAFNYGFSYLQTPTFESSDVFKRTLGDESDIVNKEMYSFLSRKGSPLTLRPEGTAPAVRAYLHNNLANTNLQKLFYFGPMFRYERPQKGRQRQFHQAGFEYFNATSLYADVEIILSAKDILQKAGVYSKTVLEINYLGSLSSRQNFAKVLTEYLQDYKQELSEDSKKRLLSNPLRILDSKDKTDKQILQNAPLISSCLSNEDNDTFAEIKELLTLHGVNFNVNNHLVRGLDYYTGFVFEFISNEIGAQSALLSGGRYDDLVEQMGGKSTPCVGFAAGLERIMLLMQEQKEEEICLVLPFDDSFKLDAIKLRQELIANNIRSDIMLEKSNISKKFKRASAKNASLVIILDNDENQKPRIMVKNMKSSNQEPILKTDLINYIKENYKELIKNVV